MALMSRRMALAAGGTLAAGVWPRKPQAGDLPPLSQKLVRTEPPAALPDGTFMDAEGAPRRLADYRGRGLVVNFWATWCAPCVAEMPALAALAAAVAADRIDVLPLSSDRGGAAVVEAWYRGKGITGLPVLLDPKGALARAWGLRGVPTTVIIGRDGLDLGRLEGTADWGTAEAVAVVRGLVGR